MANKHFLTKAAQLSLSLVNKSSDIAQHILKVFSRADGSQIQLEHATWKIAGESNVGKVRTNNEDALLIEPLPHGLILMLVADGVGGHNAGEIASQMVCDAFQQFIAKGVLEDAGDAPETWAALMLAIIHEAHRSVAEESLANEERRGMASTVIALIADERQAAWAQVGDSRLYLYRKGELEQVTHDQTVTRALVESGRLSEEEAQTHSQRNVLEHAIGLESSEQPLEPLSGTLPLQPEDQILLCTDGLTDLVANSEIAKVVKHAEIAADERVSLLVEQALAAGGRDNITMVLGSLTSAVRANNDSDTN